MVEKSRCADKARADMIPSRLSKTRFLRSMSRLIIKQAIPEDASVRERAAVGQKPKVELLKTVHTKVTFDG